MSVTTSTMAPDSLSPGRMAKDVIRRYALRGNAHVLVVGHSPGEVVSCFRSAGVMAFGLFDGSAPPRDPYAKSASDDPGPEVQPAVLHQSLPFLAQSFDCVLLRDSSVYGGSLTSPEACTATANLLAGLKPGRPLVYAGPLSLDAFGKHLSLFPGTARQIVLGTGGVEGILLRLLGQGRGQTALQFAIPGEAISRLEWHRLARQAVVTSQRQPAA